MRRSSVGINQSCSNRSLVQIISYFNISYIVCELLLWNFYNKLLRNAVTKFWKNVKKAYVKYQKVCKVSILPLSCSKATGIFFMQKADRIFAVVRHLVKTSSVGDSKWFFSNPDPTFKFTSDPDPLWIQHFCIHSAACLERLLPVLGTGQYNLFKFFQFKKIV